MKLQKRNLREFEYLPYTGRETDIDPETGLHTGEFHPEYGEPVVYEGNLSTPSLIANQTFYGKDIRYTHVLLLDDPDAEIDEYGLIRVGGDEYEIRAVRPSLNVLSLALRRITKDHGAEAAEPEMPVEPDDPADPENPDDTLDGDEP